MKPATKRFAGCSKTSRGVPVCSILAAAHDDDEVRERHRLDLVVGHIDRGHLEAPLQAFDLDTHFIPELGIEIGKRFVEQKNLGFPNNRPPHGDTLALAARELCRFPVQIGLQLQHRNCFCDPRLDFGFRQLRKLQREFEILLHGHMRIERIGLEHHGDAAVPRRHVVDQLTIDA